MSILIDKGLVIKEGNNQNLYGGLYTLTKQGFSLAKKIRERTNQAVELAGKDLDESSREIMYRSLNSISQNLKFICENSLDDALETEGK